MQGSTAAYRCTGKSGWGWDIRLPRILDEYLNCVVYMYRSRHEAEEAINIGGSAFLLGVPAERLPAPAGFTYVVTNAHVIKEKANILRINTKDGKCVTLETKNWLVSEVDDLAICAIPEPDPTIYNVRTIPRSMLVSEDFIRKENIGPGDEIVLIGRFVNLEGKERNIPSVRFGHISQMPIEPLECEGRFQDSFLCEIKSIGGFSGSPVFLAPVSETGRPGDSEFGKNKEAALLGVDWCHIQNFEHAIDNGGNEIPHIRFPTNTGMMGVVPAWKLDELIDFPREKEMRAKEEEEELKRRKTPTVRRDSSRTSSEVSPAATDANPNHQEDFTRLLNVAVKKRGSKD
jgi:hypothetical protein